MKIKLELITPKIAQMYLKNNNQNRKLRTGYLARYIDDMSNGRWMEGTSETIKISKKGNVLDGQHRFRAIIATGISIECVVAYDLDEEIFKVLDTGALRSASDIFGIAKIKYSSQMPAIIAKYSAFSKGIIGNTERTIGIKPSNNQLMEIYISNEEMWLDIVRASERWYEAFNKIITVKLIGGFYAAIKDSNRSESFMNELCTGENITNPIIKVLRQKLLQDRLSTKKIPSSLKEAYLIKSWNMYAKNINVSLLKFDYEREEYPKIYINPQELIQWK